MAACDLLIITAANGQQARQYRRRLAASRLRGPLREVARTLVLADPKGRRVGSGAATLGALLAAARLLGPDASSLEHAFAGRRVLVLHSGGDSRRLPAYAAAGKLFAPTPCLTREGLPATLFDLVLEDFLAIRWPVAGGTLVAAGDVLLNLARCAPDLNAEGVTAVACPGDLDRAARHALGSGNCRRSPFLVMSPGGIAASPARVSPPSCSLSAASATGMLVCSSVP